MRYVIADYYTWNNKDNGVLELTKDDVKMKSKNIKTVAIAISNIVVALTLNKTILIENLSVLVLFILKLVLLGNPFNSLLVFCV